MVTKQMGRVDFTEKVQERHTPETQPAAGESQGGGVVGGGGGGGGGGGALRSRHEDGHRARRTETNDGKGEI